MKLYKTIGKLNIKGLSIDTMEFDIINKTDKNYIFKPDEWSDNKRHIQISKMGIIQYTESNSCNIECFLWTTECDSRENEINIKNSIEEKLKRIELEIKLLRENFNNNIYKQEV